MAFKQRSAFKAKEGGAAFKQMGSSSPYKFLGKLARKVVGATAKVGRKLGIGGRKDPMARAMGINTDARNREALQAQENMDHSSLLDKLRDGGMGGGSLTHSSGGGGIFGMMNMRDIASEIMARKGSANPGSDTASGEAAIGFNPLTKKSKYNKNK